MPLIYDLVSYPFLLLPTAAVLAWIVSVRIYPVIILISDKKNLMDEPDDRSSHSKKTPTLGGVGMFLSFSVALMLFGILVSPEKSELIRLISVIASTILLLFLGIKDDLIALAPKKKFIGQIFAAAIVILLTDIRVTTFGGIMGIQELPYWISVLFTLCVFIVVVNAFNLSDGIDGLAGSLALVISFIFGVFFVVNGELMLSLVSFTLIGAIVGFLGYNFSDTQKLFMGDSGSLFLGYLLAYQGVSFVMVSGSVSALQAPPHAPIILLALLSYPIIDSLRVFTIRIMKGRSPFSADRNHIHHRFVEIGFSHKQATLAILISNLTLVCLIWLVNSWDPTVQFFLGLGASLALYLYPFLVSVQAENTLANTQGSMRDTTAANNWSQQLQNIPIDVKLFREVRRQFRAKPGDRSGQRDTESLYSDSADKKNEANLATRSKEVATKRVKAFKKAKEKHKRKENNQITK